MLKNIFAKIGIFSGIIRLPNLVIIAITLTLLRQMVLKPVFASHSIALSLSQIDFILLVFSIVLTASIGYIINDFYDYETDLINKPLKVYINKYVSRKNVFILAIVLSIIALVFYIVLSIRIDAWGTFILLVTALIVVWWYAKHLKKTLLWGNIAVACMSACTIPLYFYCEYVAYSATAYTFRLPDFLLLILASYTVFAFLFSFIREIVKDIEDIDGDKKCECKTLPIVKGIPFSKQILVAISVLVIFLLLPVLAACKKYELTFVLAWLVIAVLAPMLLFIAKIVKATTKNDFRLLSLLLKIIMIGGIFALFASSNAF